MVMFNIFGRRLYIHYVGKQGPEIKKSDRTNSVEKKKFEIFLKEGYFDKKSIFYGWNRPNDTNKRWKQLSLLEWMIKSITLSILLYIILLIPTLILTLAGVSGVLEFALVAGIVGFAVWLVALLFGLFLGLFLDMWFKIEIM